MVPTDVSWPAACHALCRIIPGAEVVGERISTAKLERVIHERQPKALWFRLDNRDDLDVFDKIAAHLGPVDPDAIGVLVMDMSYRRGCSPWGMPVGKMREFVDTFHDRYEDEVFAGDVLLLLEDRCIFVHHEGVFTVILAPPVAGDP